MKNWLLAARIKTLPAAISPVLLGLALAYHDEKLKFFVGLMTLIAAILIQIGTNFANDVFDFEKGTDRNDRLGPKRVTQSGIITVLEMKKAMLIVFSLSICIGCYLASVGGWPIVIIGLSSIIAGIAYTAGPYPLGYHGWGDLFVFIFFGIIAVPGTYYLQTGLITFFSIFLGSMVGMLATAILVVNNIRDIDTDKLSRKNTLAVKMGRKFSMYEYSLLMLFPSLFPLYIGLTNAGELSLLLPLFCIPISINLVVKIFSVSGTDLNFILFRTSRFMFVYTILFSIGLIL